MVPSRGREIRAELLTGAWDWQSFLGPLNIRLTGLTITRDGKSVAHFLMVIRRGDLQKLKGHEQWEVACEVQDCSRR
jgi:hypothetical protein